jgi:hypothetical protein
MLSLCRNIGAAAVLAALVIVQGLVYAAPCYKRSGGNENCRAQGGPPCPMWQAPDTLPCPGSWTPNDLVEQGLHASWPCRAEVVVHDIPKKNATSGNQPEGFMNQGSFTFACTDSKTCEYDTIPLPLPVMVVCKNPVLQLCTSHTVFTAGGANCPETSGR